MSTASVITLPTTAPSVLSLWLQKGLNRFRTANATPATPAASRGHRANRQEADKLRAVARDMMRIDAGTAADMFAAADRHEHGYSA